jgi:hypothetical protein
MYSNGFETAVAALARNVYTCIDAVLNHHSSFETAISVSLLNVGSSVKIYSQELRLTLHCLYPADLQPLVLLNVVADLRPLFWIRLYI